MSENLFEIYRTELLDSKDPGKTLRKLYWELLEVSPNRSDIIMINKLIKVYGRWNVFYAVVEIYGMKNPVLEKNTYGLFKTIIDKKLRDERNPMTASDIDLTSLSKKRKKQIEQYKEEAKDRVLPESYREEE